MARGKKGHKKVGKKRGHKTHIMPAAHLGKTLKRKSVRRKKA